MWSRRSATERCPSSWYSSGGTTSLDRRSTTPHVINKEILPRMINSHLAGNYINSKKRNCLVFIQKKWYLVFVTFGMFILKNAMNTVLFSFRINVISSRMCIKALINFFNHFILRVIAYYVVCTYLSDILLLWPYVSHIS